MMADDRVTHVDRPAGGEGTVLDVSEFDGKTAANVRWDADDSVEYSIPAELLAPA